ncbi:hypothetical protein H7J07_16590 [Mycobacterium koreense]|uniref:Uncharacterized protein n=1 Tax=Mycolicibacillus koreensis TaxID=1069220 RepID=A0A7I7S7G0_9MYCO|nr:hypothetical protein [Mycolicibacillus koreensis]MCV7249822.1 hypothetical protein [Mycolicibacillus koreensis]ODR08870.1 hypothetical protein BHQ15_08390 [Mycolicibacillus koreensis]OSC32879.1 hypothetical protein B8W67_13535 [Mycolicibacillus koreensis]BBY52814.1 hypothetical protein MKOR_00650 [Mycolicibacillus koreensis]
MDTSSGEDVLAETTAALTETFGDRLAAVYALGSLAHGGFSPLVSDVDVAAILTDPLAATDAAAVHRVGATIRARGSALHERVSLFWGSPASLRDGSAEGRFPPLDRLCLFEHGRLLAGTDVRDGLPRPTRAELIVAGAQFALDVLADQVVGHAGDPAALLDSGVRRTTKVVLFPVRFLLTADTGGEGTNDAAVGHYLDGHSGAAADLVAAAFQWRHAAPGDQTAAGLLRAGFVALYDDYLGDHIARLTELGEPVLAEQFRGWRARLQAAAPG